MSDFDLSVQLKAVHESERNFLEDLSDSVYKKYHVIPYIAEGVGYSNNCIYKPTARISISGISAEEVIFTRALKQVNIPKAFCTTKRNRQIVILLYLLNNSIVCFEAENSMFVITKNHGNQFSKIINNEMVILTTITTNNYFNNANFVTKIILLCSE